jgi:hypothetical protein
MSRPTAWIRRDATRCWTWSSAPAPSFGIATVVASHLLGEIERVCSFLLAIDNGRLLRAAPIASFTERTGTLGVEVEDGADGLAARLAAAGLDARVEGRTVLVDAPDERPYDLVRDAVDELGLGLVRWSIGATGWRTCSAVTAPRCRARQ